MKSAYARIGEQPVHTAPLGAVLRRTISATAAMGALVVSGCSADRHATGTDATALHVTYGIVSAVGKDGYRIEGTGASVRGYKLAEGVDSYLVNSGKWAVVVTNRDTFTITAIVAAPPEVEGVEHGSNSEATTTSGTVTEVTESSVTLDKYYFDEPKSFDTTGAPLISDEPFASILRSRVGNKGQEVTIVHHPDTMHVWFFTG